MENERIYFLNNWGIAFLVESNTIKTVAFQCKNALSKGNYNSNRLESTKQIYHKDITTLSLKP